MNLFYDWTMKRDILHIFVEKDERILSRQQSWTGEE